MEVWRANGGLAFVAGGGSGMRVVKKPQKPTQSAEANGRTSPPPDPSTSCAKKKAGAAMHRISWQVGLAAPFSAIKG